MDVVAPEKVRNIALLGHHGSGKTTLAEALLVAAGVLNRRGRVEDGTATCDPDPIEHERQMSIDLTVAPFLWKGHKVNLLDCPGEPDLVGNVHAALAVADLAVLVISAVEGVEPQSETAWHLAGAMGVPRMVFVNKLDRERAEFERVLAQLREEFGSGFAVLELPIGSEAALHGVVDVLHETADLYDGGKLQHGAPVPEEIREEEHRVHDEVVEEIVAHDDALLEKFLADETPTVEELEHALTIELEHDEEHPVLCGSALTGVGIDLLADFLVEIGPPPTDRPIAVKGTDGDELAVDPAGPTVLQVFRTISDPYVGQLSLFRVRSGTLRPDDRLVNSRTGDEERFHQLFALRGREHVEIPHVLAGDIACVSKIGSARTGDTFTSGAPGLELPFPDPPGQMAAVALVPATQTDDDKIGPALNRLRDEDPTLMVDRGPGGEMLLRGVGDVQLSIAVDRLRGRFGISVDTEEPKVAFRETITRPAQAEGRHKKQTGGHGQFAVCVLKVEPLPRGEGFRFEDRIVGGAISKGYIPAVQKGVEEAMEEGGEHGLPVVDVAVTLLDGKEHTVDSSELAFKLAARLAFKEACAQAGPVVLEPVSYVEVDVPEPLLGDVLGDLNSRRGRVLGTEMGDPGRSIVTAMVPEVELVRYPSELRSLSGGRGRFSATPDHLQEVRS